MVLLMALLGAAVLLSGLVMLVGYRRRGHEPGDSRSTGRESTAAGPATNAWIFGGGGTV